MDRCAYSLDNAEFYTALSLQTFKRIERHIKKLLTKSLLIQIMRMKE